MATTRAIVGIVGETRLSCGCYAQVAMGRSRLLLSDTRHLAAHVCPNWKRHKYELSDAEKSLAQWMKRRKLAIKKVVAR